MIKKFFVVASLLLLSAFSVSANRLCTSGFETNDIVANNTDWDGVTGAMTVVSTPVNSGTYALRIVTTAAQKGLYCGLTNAAGEGESVFIRFYFRRASGTGRIASFQNSSAASIASLEIDGSNQLTMTNIGDSSVITGATITADVWYRVEARVKVSDTVGELELYIDGVSQGSLTSKDTLNTDIKRIYLGTNPNSTTADNYFDDFAANDSNGTFQTGLPGAGSIAMVVPASDVAVTWTKTGANCSGTTNTDCVDDEPGAPDDLSGYNTIVATNGSEDQFAVTALPAEVPSDADITVLYLRWKVGGTSATGTNTARLLIWDESSVQTLGTSGAVCDQNGWYQAHQGAPAFMSFDPGTRTKANINSFNIGYETVSLAQTCNVTALWLYVEWVPGAASSTPPKRKEVVFP